MKLEYIVHPNAKYPYPHILSKEMAERFGMMEQSRLLEQLEETFGVAYGGPVHTTMKPELVKRFRWVLRDSGMAFKTSGDVVMAKMMLDL